MQAVTAMNARQQTRNVHELVALPYAQGLTHRVRTGNPSVASSSRKGTSSSRRMALTSGISLVCLLVMMLVAVKRMRRT